MLAILMPFLSTFLGGVLTPLCNAFISYKTNQTNVTLTELNTEIQNNALKVQVYGSPTYRFITFIVGVPVALHFSGVYVDTILASKAFFGHVVLGIPKCPAPYDVFEWAIISSFFLIHAVSKIGK
jgi:hypothetical protein